MDIWLLTLVALSSMVLLLAAIGYIATKIRRALWEISAQLRNQQNSVANAIIREINNASIEIQNAVALQALGLRFPVFTGGWSIDAFLARALVQMLMERRPKCIVELGSGSSTILIARTLRLLGDEEVTHIAIDHEKSYLDLTREVARMNGVADGIEFEHCPLQRFESLDKLWYGDLVDKIAGRKIDLLLVDGPPGPLQPFSRYPALPLLLSHLSDHCSVVLDDAGRDEERKIAEQWAAENPEFSLSFSPDGHGVAVLER